MLRGRDQRSALRNERGAALIVVLLLTALLFSLGVFGTRSGQIELMIAANDLQAKRALEAADAGIHHATSLIRARGPGGVNEAADGFDDELARGGTGGALAELGSGKSLDGDAERFAAFGAEKGDGYFVHASDNHDETAGIDDPERDRDRRIVLVSHGRAGRAERIVRAVLERDPAYPCALCGNLDFDVATLDVSLAGAFSTDSYDSSAGVYDPATAGAAGHVFSNGDVGMSGDPSGPLPVEINGNVVAARTVTQSGTVSVSGDTTSFAAEVDFAPVEPCGPPFSSATGIGGGSYDPASGILANAGPDDVIDLAPGDYCLRSIEMTGASVLRTGGAVRIRLTAPSTIRGVDNTTGVPGDLHIFSSVVSPAPMPIVPGLAFSGGARVAMAVYAPHAIVTFDGIDDFYGAAVAGMVPQAGIARLHYDAALANPEVRQIAWREVRKQRPD